MGNWSMRLVPVLACGVLGLAGGTGAWAQSGGAPGGGHAAAGTASKSIQQRREGMVALLSNMARIEQMVYAMRAYSPAEARASADEMARLSGIVYELFPPGSAGPASKARAEVWEQRDAFVQAAANSKQAIADLQAAARKGTLDELKPVYAKVPPTCVACHNAFMRQP